jgi:hypothetical protein
MAPPVKFGRRALANGARPENCATRREVFDEGSFDRSIRGAADDSPLRYLLTTLLMFFVVPLENHRAPRFCCFSTAAG